MARTVRKAGESWPIIRVWTDRDSPFESAPDGFVVVEWAGGQPGYPTSYALLGGVRCDDGVVVKVDRVGLFLDSLAGVADQVDFGLPAPYAAEVRRVFADMLIGGFEVTAAAHGAAGSSEMAFRFVARFLSRVDRERRVEPIR